MAFLLSGVNERAAFHPKFIGGYDMNVWKKWFHVVLVLVLTSSLLTPMASAVEVENNIELQSAQQLAEIAFEIVGLDQAIYPLQQLTIDQGQTVLDVLKDTLDASQISYEITESSYGPYVQTIAGTVAGTLGGWDGWSYTVNGQSPNVGMADYTLEAEDEVRIYYSKYPALEATANDRIITVSLVGDTFTEQAKEVSNWTSSLAITAIQAISPQQMQITVVGAVGTYELTALEKALSSAQQAKVNVELVATSVEKVEQLIKNVPAIYKATEVDALAVKAARKAFDALSEAEKELVTNAKLLVTRENQLAASIRPKAIVIDESYRATISPKYTSDTTSYTLNVPSEFKTIDLQATTTSEDVQVTYAIGDQVYEAGKNIPVTNNKKLTITTTFGEQTETVTFTFKTLKPVTMNVDFRVEGIAGTKLNVKNVEIKGDGAITAAEATKQILDAYNMSYNYSTSSDYFRAIDGESDVGLGAGSGWMYKVNGTYPDVYASGVTVKDGDEIVWDYINSFYLVEDMEWDGMILMYSGAEAEDKVTFNPIIEMPLSIVEGEDVHIKVTGKYNRVSYMYEPISGPHTIALADVTIEVNGKKYVTNENGEITIPAADLAVGSYEVRFTKDVPGTIFVGSMFDEETSKEFASFPRIIRTYETLFVTPKNIEQQNREQVEAALAKAQTYFKTNHEQVTTRVNESYSGFWMLAAMQAAGVDAKNYNWTTVPTAADTYWSTPIDKSTNNANTIAGTIIAAKALGLNSTALKGRNYVEDLLAIQKPNGVFSTIWGEAFAVIALQLEDANYDVQKHIDAILALQNAETGYFGDNDATGWTLFALSAFKEQENVQAAINKAVQAIYTDLQTNGFIDNANSLAAIVSGLGAVGEDVFSEKWSFNVNGQYENIATYLATNYVMDDGGVRWKQADTKSNLMALEQVYIALYDALNKQSVFYTIGQPIVENEPATPGEDESTTPNTEEPATPGTDAPVTPVASTVTMSITGPASQAILPASTFEFIAAETAYDMLVRVTQAKNIDMTARKTSMGMYVEAIAGVAEFDKGPLSGWLYSVNGQYPEVSADAYTVKQDDTVAWTYTTGEETIEAPPANSSVTTPSTPSVVEGVKETVQAIWTNDAPVAVATFASGMTVSVPVQANLKQGETLQVTAEQKGQTYTIVLM